MVTISLAMIVKNEEKNIRRCLNSVFGIADEIIIVDTGSIDSTKEICSHYTDKVYDFKWVEDFSAARNYSFELAIMEYILWLDADDFLTPMDIVKFKRLKETLTPDINSVMMKYNTGLDKQGNVIFSYYRERLTKRTSHFKWYEPVHEYLLTSGPVLEADICITHGKVPGEKKNSRNLKIYEKKLKKKETLSPRSTYYYARELKEHERYPEAIKQFEHFLDTGMGWVEDNITACSELAKCYLSLNHSKRGLAALFRSFVYSLPRAEICCQLGYYYQDREDYANAVFWFEFILSLKKPEGCWGFLQPDCWDYIPLIESAVCYDRMGNYKKALKYNTKALNLKPGSVPAKQNQEYLKNKLSTKHVSKLKGAV